MPSSSNQRQNISYGLSQALLPQSPLPIVAKRAPTTADFAQPGTLWIEGISSTGATVNTAWILVSIISNSANWQSIGGSGGSGVFSSLTVNPGPTNLSTVGNGAVTIGNATNTGAVTIAAGTGNVAITGNTNSISIGADANANAVTVGNTTNGTLLALSGGNGSGVGSSGVTISTAVAGSIEIGLPTQTGAIYLGTSTAGNTVNISNVVNTAPSTVNIASGAAAAATTVNILSGTSTAGTQTLNISGGTRATSVNIATGNAAHLVTIGSTNAAGITTIQAGGGVYLQGSDSGAGLSGLLNLTTVVNTTQGAGTLSIKSTTGNAGNNAGFFKVYIGNVTAYIPYYTVINP